MDIYFAMIVVDNHECFLNLLRGFSELVNHLDRLMIYESTIVHAILYIIQFNKVGIV